MQNTSIRLKEETQKNIEKLAKLKKRKKTDLIRLIIENYVEINKDLIEQDWLFAKLVFVE